MIDSNIWQRQRLRYVCKVNPIRGIKDNLPPDTEASFVPMECLGEQGSLTLNRTRLMEEVSTGYTYFENGDVVFAKITPCFENGKGTLAKGLENGIAFGTTELHVLRPYRFTNDKYLYYIISAYEFRKNGESSMYGAGGQKRVPENFVKDFSIQFPPLSIQKTITVFLDKETTRIDALIEKKKRQIELLQEKRQAVINRAVTKGLDPNAKMKDSGVEWIGEIPEGWEVRRLGFCCSFMSGATPDKGNDLYWCGDIPWVSPKDMKRKYIDDSIDHLTKEAIQDSGLRWVKKNSILVVVRGMILVHSFPVGITTTDLTINQDIKALNFDNRYYYEYAAYLLSGFEKVIVSLYVDDSAHGTKAIRLDNWKDFPLLCPPRNEQEVIVKHITQEINEMDFLVGKIENSIKLLQEYRSSLITSAVSGQIDLEQI